MLSMCQIVLYVCPIILYAHCVALYLCQNEMFMLSKLGLMLENSVKILQVKGHILTYPGAESVIFN